MDVGTTEQFASSLDFAPSTDERGGLDRQVGAERAMVGRFRGMTGESNDWRMRHG